ncbi:alpha/beta fold hydrolase [Phytoactinopolyspora limicola]|uniref:alpha/beta fold hydrolase n=1 Tax=Phytoactinopolyspora limicola TaxID=2715536 RepID=UPI00140B863E|nr:alpha/beta hydrolase [Phytoactinopolyspora limicola]
MNVRHLRVDANGVGIHTVVAGRGSPVVLLHGWPVTWYHWRTTISVLAEHHLVIAPDLRGLGDSDRPAGGYDKRTLADDVVAVAAHVGADRFALVGHDFGGSVAYALAAAYRDNVSHLVVEEELLPGLDVSPALVNERYPRWHNAFHAADDVPELLITGREQEYLGIFWALTAAGHPLPPDVVEEYRRAYMRPGSLRVALAYYRTAIDDAELNRRTAEEPLTTPVLAVGGDQAMAGAVEASIGQAASDVTGVVLPDCGHYPAEEHPQRFAALVADFIASAANPRTGTV